METTRTGIKPIKVGIVLFTLATALIHISLLFPDPLFILNGLGYLTLLAAYTLPLPLVKERREAVRWVFLGYAAVTIVAWLAIGDKSWPSGALGYITKLIELILIAFLILDRSQR